jgi:hypothetical protein
MPPWEEKVGLMAHGLLTQPVRHRPKPGAVDQERQGVRFVFVRSILLRPMAFLARITETGAERNLVRREIHYRIKAYQLGVVFLGVFEQHRIALFQDPVTGSSFAVEERESVESGIRRVRAKFGLP